MVSIEQIRQKIRNRDYYLSSHAEDEMVDDYLERQDVETAILQGRIEKVMTHDIRGTRYRIEGITMDSRLIHVICRFRENGSLIIITVYALLENK
jgi:muramidase (phage lysozyme)